VYPGFIDMANASAADVPDVPRFACSTRPGGGRGRTRARRGHARGLGARETRELPEARRRDCAQGAVRGTRDEAPGIVRDHECARRALVRSRPGSERVNQRDGAHRRTARGHDRRLPARPRRREISGRSTLQLHRRRRTRRRRVSRSAARHDRVRATVAPRRQVAA
jgi:hypothetical protein